MMASHSDTAATVAAKKAPISGTLMSLMSRSGKRDKASAVHKVEPDIYEMLNEISSCEDETVEYTVVLRQVIYLQKTNIASKNTGS